MINRLPIFYATGGAVIIMAIAIGCLPARAAVNPLTAISGYWYTEGREGGIQLYPCGDKVCGRFYWMKDEKGGEGEDGISRDLHNPDPALRQRPLCHTQFMSNFTPDDQGRYTNGLIYNPRDGGTYSAAMTLVDHNTLKLRGYLFFEALGESQVWTRAESMPDCDAGH